MKYIWQENDVIAGRVVCKIPVGKPDFSHLPTVTYKLGYIPGRTAGNKLCMLSLADGMVVLLPEVKTKADMADYLTKENMMPVPHAWFVKIVDEMRDWYQGL